MCAVLVPVNFNKWGVLTVYGATLASVVFVKLKGFAFGNGKALMSRGLPSKVFAKLNLRLIKP